MPDTPIPDASSILSLPYIQPAQAQKHITHNEALRRLDLLVQLAVETRDLTAPPGGAVSGARHIVGAGASGAWAGHDGEIALFEAGAWQFTVPQAGWRAWVAAEARVITHDGSAWQDGAGAALSAARLGINATADATNRLALAAGASLFSHDGAGHQIKVNKAAPGDTASLLFQTGFSGRAEMGTAGSEDFAIKVSADGAAWTVAAGFDAATGAAALAPGATIGGQVACHRGNILGPVGLTAGLPTGAVIETGEGPSGRYTRFADGTQICISPDIPAGAVTTALGALFQSGQGSWTFPQGFLAGHPPVVAGEAGHSAAWVTIPTHGWVVVPFRAISAQSLSGGTTVRLVATGRWA